MSKVPTTLSLYLSELKQTLRIATPLVLMQLLQMSVVTIDSVMAGADGALTLAGVAQGVILWEMTILIMIGFCMAMSPMIAQSYSRGNFKKARKIFQQGVWLSLVLGFLGLLLMLWLPNIMVYVGVAPEIIEESRKYLHILAFSMPFSALFLAPRYINEGIGNTKILLYVTACVIPVNILGNYILLNGLFGFPKMGISGIAIASFLSIVLSTILLWGYVLTSKRLAGLNLMADFARPSGLYFKSLVTLGAPIAASLMMEVGMFACVVLLMGTLGTTVSAANQIAFNYASITFMIPLGISMALTARMGMARGENDRHKIRRIAVSGIGLGAVVMALSVINVIFLSRNIASLYTDESMVIDMAVGLLVFVALFQISDGIQVCAAGCLRGLKDTKPAMIYGLIGYWIIGIPLGWYLGIFQGKGGSGLWLGLTVGLSITAFLGARRVHQLTRI